MGILDDAIREHLELKRRHGVPEEDIQRQEDEALGPARRDVAQQPEDGEHADAEAAPTAAAGIKTRGKYTFVTRCELLIRLLVPLVTEVEKNDQSNKPE